MIQYTTRELDAGIFQDDHLEKRIKAALKKENVKLLSVVFYMTQQGKYEVHLTVKSHERTGRPCKKMLRFWWENV